MALTERCKTTQEEGYRRMVAANKELTSKAKQSERAASKFQAEVEKLKAKVSHFYYTKLYKVQKTFIQKHNSFQRDLVKSLPAALVR